jgi:xylitol oxidase
VSADTNWAGNVRYRARRAAEPTSIDELAATIEAARSVRVLGTRHSFNDIADTDGIHLSVRSLGGEPELDEATGVVRVPAALRYGDLAPWLHERGRALANLASLPHISVGGAVATGTHGSGARIGSLATQVSAVEFVDGTGAFVRRDRGDDAFDGSVVSLGALGAVVRLELDTVAAEPYGQTVYEGARWDDVLAGFDDLQASGDSVSLFTTWQSVDVIDQVWVKSRRAAPDLTSIGARAAAGPRHPLSGVDPAPATEQGHVPGPWFERLPHFRLAFTPSAGDELQSEYLVPRADLADAIAAVRDLATRIAPVLLVSEVRTIAADRLWLSPAYDTDAVGIHFTWRRDDDAVAALLPDLEAALPATTRPHWGKLFAVSGTALTDRYPRWNDFSDLRERHDPERLFGNDWTRRLGL